ncbi:MAG: mannitol dehydrogenase family protein [Pseudomonadota bacterium]
MDELTPLSLANLHALPAEIAVPRYDRTDLAPGIVHIGLGNFHRAHQAWYLHRLMQAGRAQDWAIIGAGVRAYDAAMRGKLLAQDCLTTLVELDPSSTAAEVTGSMIDYLPITAGNRPLISQMVDPAIRIVSLTVTEGGYYRRNMAFDAEHPDIQADVAGPDTPGTAFGAIVSALKHRRQLGAAPFTVLSCDNLQNNGDILRDTVVSLARLSDPDLADWIDSQCSFPNSMVDCIVPATGEGERALVASLGIADQVPVTHEAFRHWVIEDDFCAGRPPWEEVGAILTDDVHRFEAMKLRILNGGHQILANAAELLSVATISEAAQHPLISAMFEKVERDEILPFVKEVPGFTPTAYFSLIRKRFENPKIVDTTRRVAFDGSSRHAGFVVPSIRDGLAADRSVEGLALVEALWARYCLGSREDGTRIEPNDPVWSHLTARAQAAQNDPNAWLQMADIYGETGHDPDFAHAFARHFERLQRDGVVETIRAYLNPAEVSQSRSHSGSV